MFKNSLLLLVSILFFQACASTSTVYHIDDRKLEIGKKDSIQFVNFTNAKKQGVTSSCTRSSYTISDENDTYGYLFIESISLDELCKWRGLPSGYFISNLKNELKLSSLKIVEEYDIDGFNFITLKSTDNSYINLIYIYSSNMHEFILDYEGKLHDKLLKSFKPDYQNNYLDKKRFTKKFNSSLVNKNIVNHYFEQEEIEN